MDGHVRRVGDQSACLVENRTRVIESFADVHGTGGLLQDSAHLFGNMHIQTIKDLE